MLKRHQFHAVRSSSRYYNSRNPSRTNEYPQMWCDSDSIQFFNLLIHSSLNSTSEHFISKFHFHFISISTFFFYIKSYYRNPPRSFRLHIRLILMLNAGEELLMHSDWCWDFYLILIRICDEMCLIWKLLQDEPRTLKCLNYQ